MSYKYSIYFIICYDDNAQNILNIGSNSLDTLVELSQYYKDTYNIQDNIKLIDNITNNIIAEILI